MSDLGLRMMKRLVPVSPDYLFRLICLNVAFYGLYIGWLDWVHKDNIELEA